MKEEDGGPSLPIYCSYLSFATRMYLKHSVEARKARVRRAASLKLSAHPHWFIACRNRQAQGYWQGLGLPAFAAKVD